MGDIDPTKKFAGYADPAAAIGGKPLMVAKQIYDQIFFSLMSGVEDWEKSSIDDLLKKDGLLDEGDYSNDYNGKELTEVLLNLADIALTLADKGGAASEISRNLYASVGKKASKEAKKEAVKKAVSEVGEKALKKEAGEAFENASKNILGEKNTKSV